jgi:transcriptional regulator with XRE-family HTH domain
MTITQRIFSIMEKKHISQTTLSQETGISTSAISGWKHRNAYPTADKIPLIAKCLQVSISELYGFAENFVQAEGNRIPIEEQNVFNNDLVWRTYMNKLTEKEKLEVQVFILGKGEAHEE